MKFRINKAVVVAVFVFLLAAVAYLNYLFSLI